MNLWSTFRKSSEDKDGARFRYTAWFVKQVNRALYLLSVRLRLASIVVYSCVEEWRFIHCQTLLRNIRYPLVWWLHAFAYADRTPSRHSFHCVSSSDDPVVLPLLGQRMMKGSDLLLRFFWTYPGLDKLVRVVDVKTSDGIYKRAIHTLCLLTQKKKLDHHQKWETQLPGEYESARFLLFLIFSCFS